MTKVPSGFRPPNRHITNVGHCARCRHNHVDVEFRLFIHPPPDANYWALCPDTGEPILMEMTLLESAQGEELERP